MPFLLGLQSDDDSDLQRFLRPSPVEPRQVARERIPTPEVTEKDGFNRCITGLLRQLSRASDGVTTTSVSVSGVNSPEREEYHDRRGLLSVSRTKRACSGVSGRCTV